MMDSRNGTDKVCTGQIDPASNGGSPINCKAEEAGVGNWGRVGRTTNWIYYRQLQRLIALNQDVAAKREERVK